jgi:hypothetical protein
MVLLKQEILKILEASVSAKHKIDAVWNCLLCRGTTYARQFGAFFKQSAFLGEH